MLESGSPDVSCSVQGLLPVAASGQDTAYPPEREDGESRRTEAFGSHAVLGPPPLRTTPDSATAARAEI